MSSTKARPLALILAVASFAVFGFAGCGGDDDSSGDTDSSTPTTLTGPTGSSDADADAAAVEGMDFSSDGDINEQLRDEFSSRGIPDDVSDCIIDELDNQGLTSEIEDLQNSGESALPADLQTQIQAISVDCTLKNS